MLLRPSAAIALLVTAALLSPHAAFGWGDEGHKVVALIAYQNLTPAAKKKLNAMLKADKDGLTAKDIASRALWADKFRDSDRNTTKKRYNATHLWHFVDIQIGAPDLAKACFNHPPLPAKTLASKGPANSCVVDKIDQFSAELKSSKTKAAERALALKFLLHFVGDVHQPLHAATRLGADGKTDNGGNKVAVLYDRKTVASNLHSYWDTATVQKIGKDPVKVAAALNSAFASKRAEWMAGTPKDWAEESFARARDVVYDLPPTPIRDKKGTAAFQLSDAYQKKAVATAREQLAKGGMRLAKVLNDALK